MRRTMVGFVSLAFCGALLTVEARTVEALPTLQVYAEGATAGTLGEDEQTWFIQGSPFTLLVVGSLGNPNNLALSLEGVTLVVSVPQGETGSLTITPTGGGSALTPLTLVGQSSAPETNPLADADIDIITNFGPAGTPDGYSDKSYLPGGPTLNNNHYPFKPGVSDFLLYDLFSFSASTCGLNDYNADDGSITPTSACGEVKSFEVSFAGAFTALHFDAYGLLTDESGQQLVSTWQISPGSHDTTALVPEPASILLLGSGLVMAGAWGWRRREIRIRTS